MPTTVEGIVTGLREHAETLGSGPGTRVDQVVTFTLVCTDEQPEVVVRADRLTGPLFEGDRVVIGVSTHRLPGTAIRTVMLRNLTQGGAVFGAATGRRHSRRVLILSAVAVTAAVTAGVLLAFLILR